MTTTIDRPAAARVARPTGGWLVVVLEAVLAIGAIGGGMGLVLGYVDSGTFASDLPFDSPVLGGLALMACNALLPLIAIVAAFVRRRIAMNAHRAAGVALMTWIVVQVGFIGLVSWLQPFMLALGAVIFSLGTHRQPS